MKITIGEAAVSAILGYAVVFVGLILLMCVVIILGKIMVSRKAKAAAAVAVAGIPAPDKQAEVLSIVKTGIPAPGTGGELKLYDTDPKTAAMIMAIVADETGIPLNELRFKSIKEVK